MTDELLRVRGLTTRYFTDEGPVEALTDLDLTVARGEIYGLVGQSGAGKTTAALSILDAVPAPGRVTDGEVWFRAPELAERYDSDRLGAADGDMVELRRLPPRARRRVNRAAMRFIPEDTEHAFPPGTRAGQRLEQALAIDRPDGTRPAWLAGADPTLTERLLSLVPVRSSIDRRRHARAVKLLKRLGVRDPERPFDAHPHELPEGVLRHVLIAEALATGPEVVIADEPLVGLTGMEGADVLQVFESYRDETGMGILLLSKDPQVVRALCDRVGVLYAGELVAEGNPEEVFEGPAHPSLHRLL